MNINMNKCFKCRKVLPNVDELCNHIKNDHGLCGKNQFICMRCGSLFGDFSVFKKHLRTCKREPLEYLQDGSDLEDSISENPQMVEFQDALKKEALILILEIMADMNFARSVGVKMLKLFRKFLDKLLDGVKSFFGPIAGEEYEHILEDFIVAIESSFSNVSTEKKLYSTLIKKGLLSPLQKYCMLNEDCEDSEYENEESDDEEEDNNGEEVEPDEKAMDFNERAKFSLSPIQFEIQKFFELPHVFEKVMQNTANLQRQTKYTHFINGDLWKERLKSFDKSDIVIPYHLYMDGVQLNNALGTHTAAGSESCSYITFPTIPMQYQSRLENIFTAAFHSSADMKKHGKEASLSILVDELTTLASDGLTLKINGNDVKVYFVLGLFLGDNLGQNDVSGLTTSFVSNFCCRYCRIFKSDLHTRFVDDDELLRNLTNYADDVAINDVTKTGIKEASVLNRIPHFHVVESVACDLTHDLFEGIAHYNLAESILYWIKTKKYFKLSELNERVQSFDYGACEKGNKPPLITMKKLKKKKFTMTASEMNCFSRNLIFIVGDLIADTEDKGWELYSKTMKFIELCFLPAYDDEDIEDLEDACKSMNKVYVEKFNQKMKFKHHVGTHYGRLTKRFGPLSHIKVIRLEGKHKTMKNYTKNNNNRINLSYSLARKVQYNTALRLLKAKGLQDEITTLKTKIIRLQDQDYFSNLSPSPYQNVLSEQECFSTRKVIVNGITFSTKLWLPNLFDMSNPQIHKIDDILLLNRNDINEIFVVSKTYSASYDERYGCYSVGSLENESVLIKISDFLMDHQCPIMVHEVNNVLMFRCKRF